MKKEMQICGHLNSAIISSKEGTCYCGECEKEVRFPSYEQIVKRISKEFADFKKPKDYGGGRHQTSIQYVFAHCDYTGKLNRIEINKPGGSIFYLDLKHKEKKYGRCNCC